MFSSKRFRQCKQSEDGTIECLSYRPTKDGHKIPTAVISAKKGPDCRTVLLNEDGDPTDLQALRKQLAKDFNVTCNPSKTV